MNNKSIVILLTGTIDSSHVSFMERDITKDRLQDYIYALNKWLKNGNLNIVFVENSNYPQTEILNKIITSTHFEYLSYYGQDFSREKGKGFGEINSIEYALKNSKTLEKADLVIKCNGRYYFKEISKMISYLESSEAEIIGNFRKDLSFMDSRVFVFTPHFFMNYLLKYKNYIDDSKLYYFEHALASATHELLSVKKEEWRPLPVPLLIDGISGTSNTPYGKGINKLKVLVKFYLTKLMA